MGRYQKKDSYFKKAKEKGFLARSIFKLEELDQRKKLFKPGQCIVDLGASPGSWTQYVADRIGPKGLIVAIDLEPLQVRGENVVSVQSDFFHVDIRSHLKGWMHVDGVISDMAPNTSGIQFADQERSLALCEGALEVAIDLVVTGGFFLCKIFEGPGTKDFEKKLSERFRDITRERPRAVRKASKEFYFLAKGRL